MAPGWLNDARMKQTGEPKVKGELDENKLSDEVRTKAADGLLALELGRRGSVWAARGVVVVVFYEVGEGVSEVVEPLAGWAYTTCGTAFIVPQDLG